MPFVSPTEFRPCPAPASPRARGLASVIVLFLLAVASAGAADDAVFRKVIRRQGDDGVHTFRIPGLATTNRGTVIAVFDIRHRSAADLPGDIDVGAMRSMDDGTTWAPLQRVIDFDGSEPGAHGNGVGDPAILVDRRTGAIFVVALWSHGPRGYGGSGPGMSPEETGQLVLVRSDDDGLTWSKPVNLTAQLKRAEWRIFFNGPGAGIQLRDGRLVFAAQFRRADGIAHSCFIASADGGTTWTISPPAYPEIPTNEAQIAELSDGRLLLSMRDASRGGQRAWAVWDGKAWSPGWRNLPDPTCMASVIAHPDGPLLFANPNSSTRRVAMTVRASTDAGASWSEGKLIDTRTAAYSCLTVLRDGRVGLLYETGEKSAAETLTFARFPLSWALEGVRNSAVIPVGRLEGTGKWAWWPGRHAEKIAEARKGGIDLLFLGDSITQNWEKAGAGVWASRFAPRRAANFGFGGDSTEHVLWRLDHGELEGLQPKVCVLQIGTNNVKHSDTTPAQIAEGVRAICARIAARSPQTRILLVGLFPRGATPDDPWRRKCEAVNRLLPALADGARIHFLDLGAKLLTADGTLTREVAPDLLHLSAAGYQIWADAMEPRLKELLGEK